VRPNTPSLPGAIDSLGLGFALVARRPYLALLPIGMAVAMAFLPSWTAPAAAEGLLRAAGDALFPRATAPDEALRLSRQVSEGVRLLAQENLLRLLVWQIPTLAIPSWGGVVRWEGGVLPLLGLGAALALAGFLVAACYLAPLGHAISRQPVPLAPAILRGCLSLLGYRFLLFALGGVGVGATALMVAATALFSVFLALLLMGLAVGLALLVLFHLFLTEEAIFVDRVGPVQGMLRSARVVFAHFWAALRFWLLAALIILGLRLLLERFTGSPLTALVASALYAFLATGVTAGGMVFYRERSARLPA
jgi:hypothetical protein